MCWNEWKINFPIIPIFIFRVIVKIHRKLTIFRTKVTITRKIEIGKIWNLIFLLFSRFRIFHVNLTTYEKNKIWFWNVSKYQGLFHVRGKFRVGEFSNAEFRRGKLLLLGNSCSFIYMSATTAVSQWYTWNTITIDIMQCYRVTTVITMAVTHKPKLPSDLWSEISLSETDIMNIMTISNISLCA